MQYKCGDTLLHIIYNIKYMGTNYVLRRKGNVWWNMIQSNHSVLKMDVRTTFADMENKLKHVIQLKHKL